MQKGAIPQKCIYYVQNIPAIYGTCMSDRLLTKCCLDVIGCHVFPGSLTLGEVRAALWGARAEWYYLGVVLGLPYRTLEVIEGHAVSSHETFATVSLFTI